MRIKSAWIASTIGLGLALILPVTPASAFAPNGADGQATATSSASPDTESPSGTSGSGVDGNDSISPSPIPATGAQQAKGEPPYLFRTRADQANTKDKSTTVREVSVHGWWEYIDPEIAGSKANVTVQLQQYNASKGKWEIKKAGSEVRKAKNAPGSQRANVRMDCKWKSRTARWRAVVDVDIIGMKDSPEKAHGDAITLNCMV